MVLGGRLNDALAVPGLAGHPRGGDHATRALEHHIERRLRTVAMFERPLRSRRAHGIGSANASVGSLAALACSAMPATDLDQIVNLCKRRGFVYPSAEIYGGFRSSYDYGPLGSLMLRNVARRGCARWCSSATTSC